MNQISTKDTLYAVDTTRKFNKQLKKINKQGKNLKKLSLIVEKLANREELEPKYKNHNIKDNKTFKDCKECHIEPDWLLVYRYKDNELVLLLIETSSHSEIF